MDHIFLQMPDASNLLEQILVWQVDQFLCNWLEHLSSRFLDVVIEHLAMLVQNHLVSGPVELLIRKLGGLLSVNHLNGVFHRVPILKRLVSIQVIVSISQIVHTTSIVVHIWAASWSLHFYLNFNYNQ